MSRSVSSTPPITTITTPPTATTPPTPTTTTPTDSTTPPPTTSIQDTSPSVIGNHPSLDLMSSADSFDAIDANTVFHAAAIYRQYTGGYNNQDSDDDVPDLIMVDYAW